MPVISSSWPLSRFLSADRLVNALLLWTRIMVSSSSAIQPSSRASATHLMYASLEQPVFRRIGSGIGKILSRVDLRKDSPDNAVGTKGGLPPAVIARASHFPRS